MLYDSFVLRNKTPLSTVWLSAHFFDNKVRKTAIMSSKIGEFIKLIQSSENSFNLRIRSFLTFGVVRIFARKTDYLLIECKSLNTEVRLFRIIDDYEINVKRKKVKKVKKPTSSVSTNQEVAQIINDQFIERVTAPRNINLRGDNIRGLPYFESPLPEESVPTIRVQDETNNESSRDNSLLEMSGLPVAIAEDFSYERCLNEDSMQSMLEQLPDEQLRQTSPQLSPIEVAVQQVQLPPQEAEVFVRPEEPVVRQRQYRKRRPLLYRPKYLNTQTYRVSSEYLYEYEHEIDNSFKLLSVLDIFLLRAYSDTDTNGVEGEEVESDVEIDEDTEIEVLEDVREQRTLPFGATAKNISEREFPSDNRQYLSDITNQPMNISEIGNHLLRAEVTPATDRNILSMEVNDQHMMPSGSLFPEISMQIPESMQSQSIAERRSTSRVSKRSHSESPEGRKRFRFFDDYKRLQHEICEETSEKFFENEIGQRLNASDCKTITFNDVSTNKKRDQVARDFLSLLYLQKNHKIILKQEQCFENIHIYTE